MRRPVSPWLLRHARPQTPDGSAPSRWCYGQTDWPAEPGPTRQAASALLHAWRQAGRPAGRIRCSPLQRCKQLALEIQALEPDFDLILDPRLQELDFGGWEGHPWDTVPREGLDAWAAAFATHRMGQPGPHPGETTRELVQRVARAAREGWQPLSGPPDTLWITHAGVVRAVQWWLDSGRPDPEQLPPLHIRHWPAQAPAYGCWVAPAG
jgi:alpha-ribazole phosphatase